LSVKGVHSDEVTLRHFRIVESLGIMRGGREERWKGREERKIEPSSCMYLAHQISYSRKEVAEEENI
jgi:hypothetical protein